MIENSFYELPDWVQVPTVSLSLQNLMIESLASTLSQTESISATKFVQLSKWSQQKNKNKKNNKISTHIYINQDYAIWK